MMPSACRITVIVIACLLVTGLRGGFKQESAGGILDWIGLDGIELNGELNWLAQRARFGNVVAF